MRIQPDALEDYIYEAALVPDKWPTLLERLTDVAGGVGAVTFCVDGPRMHWTCSPGIRDLMIRFLQDGWAQRNPRIPAGLSRGLVGAHGFLTEDDLFPPGAIDSDPVYMDFLRPNGVGISAGMSIVLPHGDMLVISVERDYRKGPVPRPALDVLNHLHPHLARAAMLAGRLHFERIAGAVDAFGRIGLPAVAIDQGHRVLVGTAGWDTVVGQWQAGAGDKLILADERAQAQFEKAIAMLDHVDAVRSIPLRGGATESPAVIQVVPIRREAHDVFGRASAVVVMMRPRAGLGPAAPLVQGLFDVTRAELEIVLELAAGAAPKDIARSTGKSVETVRNQVKSILRKTGCRRTGDLTRLLADIVPRN